MALELKKAKFSDFTIFEAASDLGGTWRDNTYPGCACDIPSHLYSLKQFPKAGWSRSYSRQPEILQYMKGIARKEDLGQHILYDTEITETTYQEETGFWTLKARDGREFSARALVFGTGGLNIPNIPAIPGIEEYGGEIFHSNVWDHSVDLTDKNVAIVGTGASAIQIIPEVVSKVQSLTIFQRTPPWIVPRLDRSHTALEIKLFKAFPLLQSFYRQLLYWSREARAYFFVTNPKLDWAERIAKRFLDSSIQDSELRAAVTPDYRLGCKRVLVSDDYYPALKQAHVKLINHGVSSFTAQGLKTKSGAEIAADTVIMATGFKVFDIMNRFQAMGRQQLLTEAWKERVQAYFGITVAGFPNMFILLGPNTALGHNSVILMIEAQAKYIRQCLQRMRSRRLKSLEIRGDVQNQFNDWIRKRLARTVWLTGCQSWYLDESGHNSTIWPGYVYQYQWRTRRPKFHHYIEES